MFLLLHGTADMALTDDISKRIFLVGCSRSGTTVLQVSVASHPRMTSFPETFFFQRLPGRLGRVPLWLGVASEETEPTLRNALEEIGCSNGEAQLPDSWRLRPYVDAYLDCMDQQAFERGADMWVEKTPTHVHRLRLILRYVPRVHILHMIRDGRDVVASICHRAHEYEDQFAEKQKDPSFGIRRWNRSLRESRAYLGTPGHTFVVYEQFVREPERTLRRVCEDLEISYDEKMLQGTDETAETVVPNSKGWLQQAKAAPEVRESKFQRLFSTGEKQEIEERLRLDLYDEIVKAL